MQAAAALLGGAQGVSPRLLADDGLVPSAARPQSEVKCISFSGILEDTQWCQHSCGAPVPDCPRNFCQCENALPAKSLDERMNTGDTDDRDPWKCALSPPPIQSEVSAYESLPPWTDLTRDVAMGIPAFFLHETGGHNWTAVEDALWRLTPFSRHVCAGQAQHQGSLFLLQALRKHWKRTDNVDAAGVHVSAALMSESGMRLLGQDGRRASCEAPPPEDLYSSDLDRLADELEVPDGPFLSGKPFVFLTVASPGEGFMFRHPRLNATLQRGNPLFVTNDANYMAQPSWLTRLGRDAGKHTVPFGRQARVLLPYLSDDALAAAAASDAPPMPMKNRTGVMFHGALLRNGNEGQPRVVRKAMENMLYYLSADTPTNLHMEQFPAGARADPVKGEAPSQVVASAKAMQESRICLAPEGDTPMSRRVIDALAAGCVPLFYVAADEDTDGKARQLPFAHSIDWRKIAFFMKVSECPQRDAEWIDRAYADVATLQHMANAGREAFNSFLSFGSRSRGDDAQPPIRMATALLLEVQRIDSHWDASKGGRSPNPAAPVSNDHAKTTTWSKPRANAARGKAGKDRAAGKGGEAGEAGEGGEGGAGEGGKQREETIVVDGGGGRNIWGLTPATGACSSTQPGDVDEASCAGWCQAEQAAEHCRWCKCRGCLRLADACSDDLWIHRKEYPNDPACVGPCASQSA